MGEIRFVGTGETRGYPYLVCKKRIVSSGETRGYPYPVCKKNISRFHCSFRTKMFLCLSLCMVLLATSSAAQHQPGMQKNDRNAKGKQINFI